MTFFFSEITGNNGIPEGLQTLSTVETGKKVVRQTECRMDLWHLYGKQCLGKECLCSCLSKGPSSEAEFNGSPDGDRKHRWQSYGSSQVVGPAWEHITPTVSQGLVVQKRANAAHLEEKNGEVPQLQTRFKTKTPLPLNNMFDVRSNWIQCIQVKNIAENFIL